MPDPRGRVGAPDTPSRSLVPSRSYLGARRLGEHDAETQSSVSAQSRHTPASAHSVREVVKLVLLEVPLGRLRLGVSPAKGGAHHGEGVSCAARADEQPERRANEQQRARLEGQRRGEGGEGSGSAATA